jgi:hypothetical protein
MYLRSSHALRLHHLQKLEQDYRSTRTIFTGAEESAYCSPFLLKPPSHPYLVLPPSAPVVFKSE